MKSLKVDPEAIKIGALLDAGGYVMRVERITITCYTPEQYAQHKDASGAAVEVRDWSKFCDQSNIVCGQDLACFGVKGSFVSGDQKLFDYFRSTICSGPDCGKREELSYQQGNARAGWFIVPADEIAA